MFRIEVIIDPVRDEIYALPRRLWKLRKHILWHIALEGERIMKEEAPYRTGMLHDSIWFDVDGIRGIVKLGAAAKHALYVEKGTRPSRGRYVPIIGKRLTGRTMRRVRREYIIRRGRIVEIWRRVKTGRFVRDPLGWHPGIKPNPYLTRTYLRLADEIQELLYALVEKGRW